MSLKNYLAAFVLFLCGSVVTLSSQKRDVPQTLVMPVTKATQFSQLFNFQREIQLDFVSEPIANLTRLEIGPENQWLLFDGILGEVFWSANSGQSIKKIDLAASLPGYHWFPTLGKFGSNGEFVLWGGSRDLILFDNQGKFKKKIEFLESSYHFRDFHLTDNNILGYAVEPYLNHFVILKINLEGQVFQRQLRTEPKNKNFLCRFEVGGNLECDPRGNIYLSDLDRPEIWKFSDKLQLLQQFQRVPAFFKDLPDAADLLFQNPASNFFKIQTIVQNITQNIGLFALNDSLFISQYYIEAKKQYALDLWSTSGRYYSQDQLRYVNPILAAKMNCIYQTPPPEMDAKGDLPKPTIQELKLNYRAASR